MPPKLTVTKELTGATAFETSGGYNGHSGRVQTDHVYIEGPETSSGTFTFVPDPSQAGCTITSELSEGKKLWSIKAGESSVPYLTKLECVSPEKTVRRNSVESEELNLRIFMSYQMGSADGYDLCIESIDLFGEIKSGVYEITVSAPSKEGELSATARLTVLSDSGSSGEGGSSGGDNTGGTGGGSTGGPSGEQPGVPVPPTEPEQPPASQQFIDVKAGSWYEGSVSFVVQRGLFVGVGGNRFDPHGKTSRAMVMVVIAKMAGQNVKNYDEAVKWAVSTGVSDGTNRHNNVTREQLVAMLYRYAGSPEVTGSSVRLEAFADHKQISRWAETAMEWAVSTGILQGQGDMRLTPRATATRAETAAIMERFVKLQKQ